MSKQTFGQRAVKSFNDGLIAVNVHTTVSDLDIVFFEQPIHRAHKLTAGIHLKQFRPIQRAPAINPFQSSCNFSSLFCGKQFGGFVSRGDINHSQGVLEGFTGAGGGGGDNVGDTEDRPGEQRLEQEHRILVLERTAAPASEPANELVSSTSLERHLQRLSPPRPSF